MSINGADVKLSMLLFNWYCWLIDVVLASIPVGETGTNLTTVTFGHRSGKLLATGSEDSTIHIYVIGQMTSLLVDVDFVICTIVYFIAWISFRQLNVKQVL